MGGGSGAANEGANDTAVLQAPRDVLGLNMDDSTVPDRVGARRSVRADQAANGKLKCR